MRSQYFSIKKIFPGLCILPCLFPLASEAQLLPGFIENPVTAITRPLLSTLDLDNLLPQRGKFTFPPPYNSEAIRLTNADDCNGQDCVNYIGYSYWSNINNHVGYETMLIFVGLDRRLGGAGPTLLQYNKLTDEVENLGTLFDDSHHLSTASGEGWYFSKTMPTALYIPDQTKLLRMDVISGTRETVFDMTGRFGSDRYLWQLHSSADDRVHSFTLRQQGSYEMLGCATYNEETSVYSWFPKVGAYDECQVDKSGDWLVIKEDVDGRDGEDNRIINLVTGQERILLDRDGAGGHSDLGYGYMVATDNFAPNANTVKVWDFNADPLRGEVVYHNADWGVSAPDHISHTNAASGAAGEQFACGSSVNHKNSGEANEIICFGLDGTAEAVVVAPVMTSLDGGGGSDEYAKMPKGNVDVSGRYFIWSSNTGGSRLDVFLAKLPVDLLSNNGGISDGEGNTYGRPQWTGTDSETGSGVTAPPPAIPSLPAPKPLPVDSADWRQAFPLKWQEQVNTLAEGSTLLKSGGCDGCPDGLASSVQKLANGNGYVEFTVYDTNSLAYLGVSREQSGTGPAQMDFALRIQAGGVEVRENGVYQNDMPVNYGDVLRITVQNGKVTYASNGSVFHTSAAGIAWPLRVYASLYFQGTSLNEARVAGGNVNLAGSGSAPVTSAPAS